MSTPLLRRTLVALCLCGLAVFAAGSLARSSATRPTTATPAAGCADAGCHADVKAYTFVHGPAASNDCESCHTLVDAQRHRFETPRKNAELCTYCHEFSVANMPVVHKPVAAGECLGCHNPHGGNSRAALREKSTEALCASCHDKAGRDKKFLHAPVEQGACDSCHPPHAARFPKLLDAVGSDLCLACHKEMQRPLASAKHKHKALEDGCEKCHDAHGSSSPMSLRQPQPGLCLDCHKDLAGKISKSAVAHSAISSDRLCMNCHAAHTSNEPKLQRDLQVNTCLSCHAKPIKTDRGYSVAATPEVADKKLVRHGEINDGQCAGCHDLHGAEHRMLLKKPFTQNFYQQFAPENYALCFSCHNTELATLKQTSSATAFRNGNVNLHWIHANSGDRDKNCRTCHAAHATPGERLVRATFHFGKRDLPVAFTKTASGGSCAPGCHAAYGYDRERAVPLPPPTTQPMATRPAPPSPRLPRAEREDLRFVKWSAKDTAGNNITVPSAHGGATAIVLIAAGDAESPALIKRYREAAVGIAAARVVFIATGRPQAELQEAIIGAAGSASLILDASGAVADALEARAFPMALVLRAEGLEVARISGQPEFFASKLRAYLAAASAPATTAPATQPTAAPEEATPDQRLARDLRAAKLLLSEGKAQEAIAHLPGSKDAPPEAQLLRAQAMLALNRPDEAILIAERLPRSAISDSGRDLLRAHGFILQQRWYLARPMLEKLLQAPAPDPQAHFLMARIHEHDQNWQKAAEHYRAAAKAQQ
jgi:predicted CXXCH cytochrome family protein